MCAALQGRGELALGHSCAAPASHQHLLEGLGSAQSCLRVLQVLSSTKALVGEAKGQIFGMDGGGTEMGCSEPGKAVHVEHI